MHRVATVAGTFITWLLIFGGISGVIGLFIGIYEGYTIGGIGGSLLYGAVSMILFSLGGVLLFSLIQLLGGSILWKKLLHQEIAYEHEPPSKFMATASLLLTFTLLILLTWKS